MEDGGGGIGFRGGDQKEYVVIVGLILVVWVVWRMELICEEGCGAMRGDLRCMGWLELRKGVNKIVLLQAKSFEFF